MKNQVYSLIQKKAIKDFETQRKLEAAAKSMERYKGIIRTTKEKFDYAYIDIHYGTGATEYIETILPMRKIFSKRFPDLKVEFWAEEEMQSQYTPEFGKQWTEIKKRKR